jgi:hypothetical protein
LTIGSPSTACTGSPGARPRDCHSAEGSDEWPDDRKLKPRVGGHVE